MTITRELTLALNQFTQDVARARADYLAHCRVKRDLVNGARAERRAA